MTTEYIEGQALVASPFLMDPNFLRTVVYIVKHDEDGAYGLVLNRPLTIPVGKLLRQLLETEVENAEPIYYGGPVEGSVVILHEQPAPESSHFQPGVYLTSDQDELANICQQSASRYRVFNGYAGWAPGQLEDELEQGGWLVWKLGAEDIFSDAEHVWQNAVRQIGTQIITESINLVRVPKDPSLN